MYDKLNGLSSEISEGIVNLSNGKRWLVESELRRLQNKADQETSPEVEYNVLLFRKYAEVANQIKDSSQRNDDSRTHDSRAVITATQTSGTYQILVSGFEFVKRNLFWMRMLSAMFAFISFVVMSTVPHIYKAHLHPNSYKLVNDCYFSFHSITIHPAASQSNPHILIYNLHFIFILSVLLRLRLRRPLQHASVPVCHRCRSADFHPYTDHFDVLSLTGE